jgi:DNA invertase Pin-like site-specific DNA recombinase
MCSAPSPSFERNLILERTRAGLAAARKRGTRLGPPVKWSPDMATKARSLMAKDGLNADDAAKVLGVSAGPCSAPRRPPAATTS